MTQVRQRPVVAGQIERDVAHVRCSHGEHTIDTAVALDEDAGHWIGSVVVRRGGQIVPRADYDDGLRVALHGRLMAALAGHGDPATDRWFHRGGYGFVVRATT